MENTESRLYFASDYMEGAHPAIMKKLMETNLEKTVGYGQDPYTEDAKEKIRKACNAPEAEVFLLVGGTQTNATVIDALLKSYQGVVAADTGHIATHESGAIEFGGHKVLTVPQKDGKISAQQIEKLVKDFYDDANYEHMVMPGMVYISQPTEYGTLYSREELAALSKVCRENHLPLYVDGARLAYALARYHRKDGFLISLRSSSSMEHCLPRDGSQESSLVSCLRTGCTCGSANLQWKLQSRSRMH